MTKKKFKNHPKNIWNFQNLEIPKTLHNKKNQKTLDQKSENHYTKISLVEWIRLLNKPLNKNKFVENKIIIGYYLWKPKGDLSKQSSMDKLFTSSIIMLWIIM